MKPYERMFYVAIAMGLIIKFPWLIGVAIMVGILLAAIMDNSEENK
jgi:hypothetical protein